MKKDPLDKTHETIRDAWCTFWAASLTLFFVAMVAAVLVMPAAELIYGEGDQSWLCAAVLYPTFAVIALAIRYEERHRR